MLKEELEKEILLLKQEKERVIGILHRLDGAIVAHEGIIKKFVGSLVSRVENAFAGATPPVTPIVPPAQPEIPVAPPVV
jgi:hypothetical protein